MSSLVDSAGSIAASRIPATRLVAASPRPARPGRSPFSENRLIAAVVVAGHALLLVWLPTGAISPASGSTPAVLIASWIDASASSTREKAVKAQPPAPLPAPAPKATPRTQSATPRPAADKPATLLSSTAAPSPSAATAASTSSTTAAAAPVADSAAATPQPAASAAGGDAGPAGRISPPRFDADYLKNPAPAYPRSSRERGEAGLVVLRVLVSRDGLPLEIDLQRSSGFERLDEAALAAVRHWQFLPARQGGEAIAARVLVPISFNLRS